MINERRTGVYLPLRRPLYLPPRSESARFDRAVARDEAPQRSVNGSVSGRVTLTVALFAALITMFLWGMAQFSGASVAPDRVPEQLGVMQVQAGETLQAFASRVMPDIPSTVAVDRIEELNQLQSPHVQAGQTLIAPIS